MQREWWNRKCYRLNNPKGKLIIFHFLIEEHIQNQYLTSELLTIIKCITYFDIWNLFTILHPAKPVAWPTVDTMPQTEESRHPEKQSLNNFAHWCWSLQFSHRQFKVREPYRVISEQLRTNRFKSLHFLIMVIVMTSIHGKYQKLTQDRTGQTLFSGIGSTILFL